jgi:hypothetical protein
MEEGQVGYAKGLVTEYIRLFKVFKNTVHIVPFLPPPIGGTNDPELLRAMLDILSWIEKLQKWDLSAAYVGAYRARIFSAGIGPEQVNQNIQRHKMPKVFEAYNDKVFTSCVTAGQVLVRSGRHGPEVRTHPRYLIVHCCDNLAHCADVRKEGKAGTDACKKILTDLAEPNALLASHLNNNRVKMLQTGDILTGIKNATSGQLMDSMYKSWNTDPVHGEKVAYNHDRLEPPGHRPAATTTATAAATGGTSPSPLRRLLRSSQPRQIFQPRQEGFFSVQGLSSPVAASRKDFSAILTV